MEKALKEAGLEEKVGLEAEEPWQEARAMTQYALDSEEGLVQIESRTSREVVKLVIGELVDRVRMDPLDIFKRILPCSANVVLLEWYRETFLKGPKWLALVDDVVQQPEEVWEELDLRDMLPAIFGDGMTIAHLIKKHRDVMRNPDSMFSSLNASRGWMYCVRYHVANGDHQRAWDEMKRAQSGLFNSDFDGLVKDGVPEKKKRAAYKNRCYRINRIEPSGLGTLVRELHAAMCEAGLLQAVIEDSCTGPSGGSFAGKDMVNYLVECGARLRTEGEMARQIARYFRVCDNERRQTRAQERARMADESRRAAR